MRPILDAAYDAAPDRTLQCVRRYHGSETNLRTHLHRILGRAGIVPWPKTFVNLRGSCRTDQQENFPDHVINTWLGHSSRIAERHYLQTTDGHWEKAAQLTTAPVSNGGNAGGNIGANPGERSKTRNAKIPAIMAPDGAAFSGISIPVPPQGLE